MNTFFLPRHKIEFKRWLLCFVIFLLLSMQERAVYGKDEQALKASPSETKKVLNGPKSDEKSVPANSKAKAISGHWAVVHPIQDVLDDAPPPSPDYRGRVMTFDIQIIDSSKFWNDRAIKQVGTKIKQFAAVRGHKIIAGGMFGGKVAKRPRAYLLAWFVLTQKEGKNFLCLLNVDSFEHGGNVEKYYWEPCQIHHIAGKIRKKDLLFVEMNNERNKREVYAFRYIDEVDLHVSAGKKKGS